MALHVYSEGPGKCQIPSLIDATSDQLLSGLNQKCFTSVDLVNAYFGRTNEVNPALHAVMESNPDAWSIAAQLDLERAQGKLRGPLHGLPVLIKGNIGTRDRMQTNDLDIAGSYALQDATPPADSTVAAKLREHGLLILGKASLTEWSMFRCSNGSHGWDAVFGPTYGAYHPKQCPSGSSGGSAVATDLGLAWATLGTETSGSIVGPSDKNNIVGIKPTVGLTSRYLVVPVSEHQDTVGPMARTVKDAAKLLQAITGVDPNDNYTSASPFKAKPPDYLAACKSTGLQGKRIGIAQNAMAELSDSAPHVLEAFDHAISIMTTAGATIVENTNFTAFARWKEQEYNPVTRADFVTNLAQYLSKLERNPNSIHNIQDLRNFTQKCPEEEYPARDTAVWDVAIELNLSNTSLNFKSLYEENLHIGGPGGILGALSRHNLDAIVLPATVAPFIPALIGTPIVTVPLGAAPSDFPVTKETRWDAVENGPGIPFGISFLGAKWSEETLIEIAYAFEQRTLARKSLRRHVEPRIDLVDVLKGKLTLLPN
ncbi:MAG: hypothetical protein M1834_005619 [Cirrosporium novae-zelandiae]|nr:MAG: hypothetical protein M1834_005619 [Cirrosporium novae-zelandiae]